MVRKIYLVIFKTPHILDGHGESTEAIFAFLTRGAENDYASCLLKTSSRVCDQMPVRELSLVGNASLHGRVTLSVSVCWKEPGTTD